MTCYSHSRISTFENCPYQYKLKYIDRIKVDIQTTIEAFMGNIVHKALEKLYKDKKFAKEISKEIILNFYNTTWNKTYSKNILIAKANQGMTSDNYKKMGEKFISDYYDKMAPFEQLTILGLETQDRMTLPDGNQWHIRIDKLACDNKGNYYVCDYKTNARMKTQEEADNDRQLALYSIWVKNKFKDAKNVKLVWHMLAFNKDTISEKTDNQLEELQKNICKKIKEIESTTEFPRKQSGLCDYCIYKNICPSFKHKTAIKENIKEFNANDGIKFVNEYSEIKKKLSELKEKENSLKEKLINYAKQKDIDIIYGDDAKANIKEFDKIVLPENKKILKALLENKGLWNKYSMICYAKLNNGILKNEIPSEISDNIDIVKSWRIGLTK